MINPLRFWLGTLTVFLLALTPSVVPVGGSVLPATAATVGSGACQQTVDVSDGVTATSVSVGGVAHCVVTFSSVGSRTWTVPSGVTSVSYLIVGGGGGGGGRHGGGGGGGGVLSNPNFGVTPGASISITVGAGGAGSPYLANNLSINGTTARATKGTNSSAFGVTAVGGGAGMGKATESAQLNGGSGGGSDSSSSSPGSGTTQQGNGGGQGFGSSGLNYAGGGGGGAGTAGGTAASGTGGSGGSGISSDIAGTSLIYGAGGGGGTDRVSTAAGAGGSSGVGGNGGKGAGGTHGLSGRGGGGGGGGHDGNDVVWAFAGGDGGSGVVIVRYATPVVPGTVQNFVAATRFVDAGTDTDSVTLSWNALTGLVAPVTQYEIDYSTSADFSSSSTRNVAVTDSAAAKPNSTTISNLVDGARYFFRIKARNAVGVSANYATTQSVPLSAEDYALTFNGTNVRASGSAVIPASGNFTVEAWINPDSVPSNYQAILFQGAGYYDRFALYLRNDTRLAIWRDGNEQLVDIGNIVGQWSHIAVSVDRAASSNNVRVYLNGGLVGTVTIAGLDGAGAPFFVGVDGRTNFPYPFGGEIDQVKVWSTALSATQVQESMHVWSATGVSGSPGLVSHYDFNDNTQATTLHDMFGTRDLTITNATSGSFTPLVETPTRAGYDVYRFTRSYLTATGGWTVPGSFLQADYLVVAGGGGGGGRIGGGGGAGGLLEGSASVTAGAVLPVVVGVGGAGGPGTGFVGTSTLADGKNGGASSALGITAAGGGGGAGTDSVAGLSGGSGGGGSRFTGQAGLATPSLQGNNGGVGSTSPDRSGGGGGALSAGASGATSGNGGAGLTRSITGASVAYAGGGGGSAFAFGAGTPAAGTGGLGGGGAASRDSVGVSGTPATGGGGGGGGYTSNTGPGFSGGRGGSGVVVLALQRAVVTATDPSDVTTLSGRTIAFSTNTAGSEGTLTFQWQVSSDNGSTWSNVATGTGGTTATYTTPTLQASDSGKKYRVVVSSTVNGTTASSTSNPATLAIDDAGYSMVFDSNHSGASSTLTFGSGDTITLPTPARTGYVLDGWFTASSGGTRIGGSGETYSPLDAGDLILRYELDDLDSYSGVGTSINDTAAQVNTGVSGTVNGTISGGATFSPGGGTSLNFDGVNDYVMTGNLKDRFGASNLKISLFAWVYPTGNGVIVSEFGESSLTAGWRAAQIELEDGTLLVRTWDAGGYTKANAISHSLALNQWHYVGLTHDGSTLTAYVNGTSVGTKSYVRQLPTSGAYYGFGANPGTKLGSGTFGNFKLGSAHIYKAALTASEVAENFKATCARFDDSCAQRTAYAQWTANTYAVTFNQGSASGASGIDRMSTKTHDLNLTLPNSATANSYFTRTGHAVTAWSLNSDGSTSDYALGASYTTEAADTLYPVWTPDTYPVTFNKGSASGVTGIDRASTKTYGVALALPNSATGNTYFTRTGYTVTGWSTNADGSTTDYALGANYTTEAIGTLYPVWSSNSYTITWDANGGSSVSSPSSFTFGASIAQPANPTLENKVFMGWSTSETSNQGDSNNRIASWPHTPNSAANLTLYAMWADALMAYEPFSGTAGENIAGGSGTGSSGLTGTWSRVLAEKQGSADSLSGVYTSVSGFALPPNTGFTVPSGNTALSGPNWNLYYSARALSTPVSFNSAGTYYFTYINHMPQVTYWGSAMVGLLSALPSSDTDTTPWSLMVGSPYGSKFSIDYGNANRATWVAGQTRGSVASGTEVSAMGTKGSAPTTASTAFFVLVKIETVASGSDRISLRAFSPSETLPTNDSTIVWDVTYATPITGSGTHLAVETEFHGTIDEFRLGYTYDSVTNVQDSYAVTYNSGGGSAVSPGTFFDGGAIASAPSAPTRTGYTFSGWSATSGGSTVTFPYSPGVSSDVALYAKWTANTNTVTFKSNYVGGASDTTQSITTDVATALTLSPFNRAGHSFAGWATSSGGSVVHADGATLTLTAGLTLHAVWTTNSYTIIFNKGSATGTAGADQTATKTGGVNLVLPNSATANTYFTRSGYTVTGWSVNANGSTTDYALGANYTTEAIDTLYPVWSASTFTVTFNKGSVSGATGADQSVAKTGGVGLSLPNSATANTYFTKTGYTVTGWSVNADGSTSDFALGGAYTTEASDTLYPVWTPNTYTVTYAYNSATGGNSVTSASYTVDGIRVSLPTPTKTGFTFDGWYSDVGLTTLVGGAGASYAPTGNVTLYAKWNPATFTVIYEYNGANAGNTDGDDEYTTGGTTITLPTPTKPGYAFGGWYSDVTLTASVGAAGASYQPTANLTIFAKWTATTRTVTYNSTNTGGVNASSGAVPVDSGSYIIGNTVVVKANSGVLARTGYTFEGWVTNADGTGTALNAGETLTVAEANINLYPKWSANTYTITYNKNGGTGDLSAAPSTWQTNTANVTLPSSGLTKTGFTFDGWQELGSTTKENFSYQPNYQDVTLVARWTIKSVDYSFDKGTAAGLSITGWPSDSSANFASTITLPNLAGTTVTIGGSTYLFFGWESGGTSYNSGDSYVMTETAPAFEAQWVQLFDVRFGFGGGTHSVAGDGASECDTGGLCVDGEPIVLRSAPDRPGYTFDGWKVQDTSTVKAASAAHNVTASGYLFYAQWTAVSYRFTFNSLGGTLSPSRVDHTIGQLVTMPSPGTRTGYSFGGWSADGGLTTYITGSSYVVGTEGQAFTAQWIPDIYAVTYDWQGGAGATPKVFDTYTVGTGDMTLPTASGAGYSRDGYNFSGWSTSIGGSLVSGFRPTADDVLYAIWADGNYTLSYDPKGGTIGSGLGTVSRGSSVTLPTPVRSNFTLVGWFTAPTGGTNLGDGGDSFTPSSSSTLYARWVQDSLYGVDLATLETASNYTASNSSSTDTTLTHDPTGTSARVQIPSGALPNGTVVTVRYFKETSHQADVIPGDNTYFFALLVSWLNGSGDSATVPNTAAGKPITVTLNNSNIKAGALVYQVIGERVTELGRATVDGSVTVELTEDPQLVVAATTPSAPTSVAGTAGDTRATVSWTAGSSGGSAITGYTVTASPGGATCSTASTSCTISSLTNNTAYTFRVVANNALGASSASSASSSVTPVGATYAVTFDASGGSSVANGSFFSGSTVTAPTNPSRPGFVFAGWATTQGDATTRVTFPYAPGVTNAITLYALWTVAPVEQSSRGGGNSGANNQQSNRAPVVPPGRVNVQPQPVSPLRPITAPIVIVPERGFDPDGGSKATVGGQSAPVTKTTPQDGGVSVGVGRVQVEISPGSQQGPAAPSAPGRATDLSVSTGQSATVSGGGLLPGSVLQVWLPGVTGGVAKELARIPVRNDGSFASELTFAPQQTGTPVPIGRQVLQVTGFDERGNQTVVDMTITIAQGAPSPEPNRATGSLPGLLPGQSLATAAGIPENVVIEARPEVQQVAVVSDGWSFTVGLPETSGSVEASEGGASIVFEQQQTATVSGDGFQPDTRVDIWLFSDPTLLGSVVVAADGSFSGEVYLDPNFAVVGEHTLQLQGVGMDGFIRAANLGVVVEGFQPPTSETGSSVLWWVLGGGASLALLIALVLLTRSRGRRTLR